MSYRKIPAPEPKPHGSFWLRPFSLVTFDRRESYGLLDQQEKVTRMRSRRKPLTFGQKQQSNSKSESSPTLL